MKTHFLLMISATALLLAGCRKAPTPPVERSWLTMGTFASVTLRHDDAEQLALYHTETAACFEALNQALSVYLPDSEITQLNTATGMVTVSPQTFVMLQETARYASLTKGAFDPTVAPLIQLWGFSGGKQRSDLPEVETIAAILGTIVYQHLRLDPTSSSAGFDQPGMSLDLGGIAKGFAVDRAYDRLIGSTPANALINLGGNIRCYGKATPERPWKIGVRDPFDTDNMLGSLTIASGMAVATSGNYERFVTIKGKRYAHIIDPRSGYPVKGMVGVTILSPTATEADAMSTALFVAGIQGAPALLAKVPGTQALLVPNRKPVEIWVTPGFAEVFTPLPEYEQSVHLLSPDIELELDLDLEL